MEKLTILVVEDNPLDQQVMADYLDSHAVEFAGDMHAAVRKLEGGRYDLCFIDLQLGKDDDCSGLKLIPLAAAKGIYSVVMSGHDSDDMVKKAHELGCNDFYPKGNQQSNVGAILAKFLQSRTGFDAERVFAEEFITEDPYTRDVVARAVKYASSDLPVMLVGPSGAGKTWLGRLIHEHSGRQGRFMDINCSAYTDELVDAELFGSKKGSFTGAAEDRKGILAQAHQGTLFLDEIGAMSFKMQTSLLKAIEERSFYPVGSDKLEFSDFRIVSATQDDLQELVTKGCLRFDLFQRIHGLTITLKPLAQRKCDIMPLIRVLTRNSRRLAFSDEARDCLLSHPWPGNTRELKRIVDLLVAGPGGQVTADQVRGPLSEGRVTPPAATHRFVGESQYRYALEHGLHATLDRFASEVVQRSLKENGGRKVNTMSALRISSRKLYSVLKGQAGSEKNHEPEELQA